MSSPSSRNLYYGEMYSDTSSNNSNLSQRPSSSSPATETTRLHDRYGHIPNQHLQFPHHLNQARGQEETRQSANSFTPTMFTYPGWPSMSTQHAPQHPASYYPGFSQYQAYAGAADSSAPRSAASAATGSPASAAASGTTLLSNLSALQHPAGLHVSTFGAPQTIPQICIAPPSPGQDRSAPNLYRMPTRPPMEAAAGSAASAAGSSAEGSAPRSPASAAASGTSLLSNSTPEPAQRFMSTLTIPSFQNALSPGLLSPSSGMPNLISWLTPQRGLEGMQQQQTAEHGFTQSPQPNWTPQPNKFTMTEASSNEPLVTPTTGRRLHNLLDCTPGRLPIYNATSQSVNHDAIFLTNLYVYECNKKCLAQNFSYFGKDCNFSFLALLQQANYDLLEWMVLRLHDILSTSTQNDMPPEQQCLIHKLCDLVCTEIQKDTETVPTQVLNCLHSIIVKFGEAVAGRMGHILGSLQTILKGIINNQLKRAPEFVDQVLNIISAAMSDTNNFLNIDPSLVSLCLEAAIWSGQHQISHSSDLGFESLNQLLMRVMECKLAENFSKNHFMPCVKQAVGMLSDTSVTESKTYPLFLATLLKFAPQDSGCVKQLLEDEILKIRPQFSKADAINKSILLTAHASGSDIESFKATLLEICQEATSGASSSRASKLSSAAGSSQQKYKEEETSDDSPESSSEDDSTELVDSELNTMMNASELLEKALLNFKKMKFSKEMCPNEQLAWNSRNPNVHEIVRGSGVYISETEYENIIHSNKSVNQIVRCLTKAVFTSDALLGARVVKNLHSKAVAAINVATRQIAEKINEKKKSRVGVIQNSLITSAISRVLCHERNRKK